MNGMLGLLVALAQLPGVAAPSQESVGNAYRMELRMDTGAGHLGGRMEVDYVNDSGQPLEEIHLRLDPNLGNDDGMSLDVRSVHDAAGRALVHEELPQRFAAMSSERARLRIALAEPLEAGATVRLSLEFELTSPQALAGELIVLQDDPYPSLDAWYPKAMSLHGGEWSLDDDRLARYDVVVELPAALAVASTGAVVEEQTQEQRRTLRLQADAVRGFTIYASAMWDVFTDSVGDIELRYLLPRSQAAWAPRLLEAAADAITWCSERYGEYPTRHLDMVGIETQSGGGAFAACNVTGIYLTPNLEDRYRWLVAHEVVHQYFGNLINQHRDDMYWVIIGLGMIVDRHYLLEAGLDDANHRQMIRTYLMVQEQGRDTSLAQSYQELVQGPEPWSFQWNLALGHGKAFAVCSLLEDLVGEEEFEYVIAGIIEEHAGGLIRAEDLLEACEEELGGDLAWFAADWIEGNGTLDYAVTAVRECDEGWEVEVTRLGAASFPVLVEVRTASGERLQRRAAQDLEVSRLVFETDDEVVEIVLGPHGLYPDTDPSNDRWSR